MFLMALVLLMMLRQGEQQVTILMLLVSLDLPVSKQALCLTFITLTHSWIKN